jgi:hypothetical protein
MRHAVTLLAALAMTCVAVSVAWAVPDGLPPGPLRDGGPVGPRGPGDAPGQGAPPFAKFLYPPELVMSNQLALNLSDDQVSAIKKLLNDTHARIVDLQADQDRIAEKLNAAMEPTRVDEKAVLALADLTMKTEAEVKKAHLTLLIRVKNLLTDDQQAKLQSLRPRGPRS